MSVTFSEKINQSYQTAVHVAYAVVLGLTFESVTSVYSSPSAFLGKISKLDPEILAFTFAYLIFVTSWIGYVRSISKNGYRDNLRGTIRFLLDLLVVFFYYQAVLLASKFSTAEYADIFILFFVIFLTYVLWDAIKILEYREIGESREKQFRFHRLGTTISYFFASAFLLIAYKIFPIFMVILSMVSEKLGEQIQFLDIVDWGKQLQDNTDLIWNGIFTVLAIILVIMYRWRKWSSP